VKPPAVGWLFVGLSFSVGAFLVWESFADARTFTRLLQHSRCVWYSPMSADSAGLR
jgi:hypothetical protein